MWNLIVERPHLIGPPTAQVWRIEVGHILSHQTGRFGRDSAVEMRKLFRIADRGAGGYEVAVVA